MLVHQWERGRRFYVRFRVWNRHQTKGVWYPAKRGFIVPLQRAEALAQSLLNAVNGRTSEKPGWLLNWEAEERMRLREVADRRIAMLNAGFNRQPG